MNSKISEQVYSELQRVPNGRVVTYGALARAVRTSPRVVGNVLHKNPNPAEIPCHRVVNAQGKLAENFAFGGASGQAQKLAHEGVNVINNTVDLQVYEYKMPSS